MRTGNNIRLRSDGRYEARYIKDRDEKGKPIYASCYGKTYEEAVEKRDLAQKQSRPVREMNLLILGAGSHGTEVQELARSLGIFRKIAFLDDDPEKGALGRWGEMEKFVEEYPIAIPAIGEEQTRMRLLKQLVEAGFVIPVLIHPTAVVSPSTQIAYGSVICARAAVGAGAEIGKGCIISSGATINRFVRVPDGTHVDCGRVITSDTDILL